MKTKMPNSLKFRSVQKFASTTIRRFTPQYPELYTWQGCASFISDYICYEAPDEAFLMVSKRTFLFYMVRPYDMWSLLQSHVGLYFMTLVDERSQRMSRYTNLARSLTTCRLYIRCVCLYMNV